MDFKKCAVCFLVASLAAAAGSCVGSCLVDQSVSELMLVQRQANRMTEGKVFEKIENETSAEAEAEAKEKEAQAAETEAKAKAEAEAAAEGEANAEAKAEAKEKEAKEKEAEFLAAKAEAERARAEAEALAEAKATKEAEAEESSEKSGSSDTEERGSSDSEESADETEKGEEDSTTDVYSEESTDVYDPDDPENEESPVPETAEGPAPVEGTVPVEGPVPAEGPVPVEGTPYAHDDPHVTNIRGETFNVFRNGHMEFLRVPLKSAYNDANLTILGIVQDMVGTSDECAQERYITSLLIGGAWVGNLKLNVSIRDGELVALLGSNDTSFDRVNPSDHETPIGELLHLHVQNKEQLQLCTDVQMCISVSAAGNHDGKHFFLNLDAKAVTALNTRIGGLLGEDSHEDVSTRPLGCLPKLIQKHGDAISFATAEK